MKSDRLGVVFIHIPKCGGTSIERVLFEQDEFTEANFWMGRNAFQSPKPGPLWGLVHRAGAKLVDVASLPRPITNIYQTGGLQHLTALQVRHAMGRERFESAFRFAVVRNPLRRSLSQYHYMKRRPDLMAWIGMREDDSFKDYLTKTYSRHHVQWQPQVSFLYDYGGQRLVDEVIKLEALDAGMRGIFDRLGLPAKEIPHLQKSKSKPSIEVSEEETAMVWELYKEDFEVLNYEMGPA